MGISAVGRRPRQRKRWPTCLPSGIRQVPMLTCHWNDFILRYANGYYWPGARVRTNHRKAPADACPHLLAALAHARDGGQASCKSDQLKLRTFLMVSAAREPFVGTPRPFMRSSWVWLTFACPDSALWLLVFPSPLFLMPLQEGALHGSQ